MYDYAQKKEKIIMVYTSLHTDMQKDIHKSEALATDTGHVRDNILEIATEIELCGTYLEKMIEHAHGKENITHHEKVFFANLLVSFSNDLVSWVGAHEKEVF